MANITITQQEYQALISFAKKGASTTEEARNLDAFLRSIEKNNGITRYSLWVQWQEAGVQVPITVTFPTSWPPDKRHYIELLTRPIAKADVTAVLSKKAVQPMNVMVTPDPAAIVGWTLIDDFFQT